MRRQGFTIVELVMVVAIIGIVAGIAMPRFTSAADSNRADVAARRLMADLAMLRLAARSTSASTSVTFTTSTNSYVMTGAGRVVGETNTVKLSDFPYSCKIKLPAGAASATLSYNQYGVPTSSMTVYIESGKFRRTVTVDANTGAPASSANATSTAVVVP